VPDANVAVGSDRSAPPEQPASPTMVIVSRVAVGPVRLSDFPRILDPTGRPRGDWPRSATGHARTTLDLTGRPGRDRALLTRPGDLAAPGHPASARPVRPSPGRRVRSRRGLARPRAGYGDTRGDDLGLASRSAGRSGAAAPRRRDSVLGGSQLWPSDIVDVCG